MNFGRLQDGVLYELPTRVWMIARRSMQGTWALHPTGEQPNEPLLEVDEAGALLRSGSPTGWTIRQLRPVRPWGVEA